MNKKFVYQVGSNKKVKTVTTASGNRYTVIDRVKFTDKECRQTRLKLQLLNNVYSAENARSSIEY